MLDLLGGATSWLRISLSKSLRVFASRAFHPILLDHPKPLLISPRTHLSLAPSGSLNRSRQGQYVDLPRPASDQNAAAFIGCCTRSVNIVHQKHASHYQ